MAVPLPRLVAFVQWNGHVGRRGEVFKLSECFMSGLSGGNIWIKVDLISSPGLPTVLAVFKIYQRQIFQGCSLFNLGHIDTDGNSIVFFYTRKLLPGQTPVLFAGFFKPPSIRILSRISFEVQ